MRRVLAIACGWVLLDAAAAPAQWGGFTFHGRRVAVHASWGGYPYPVWGPPVVVVPSVVVVRPANPFLFAPRLPEPEPLPDPDPRAAEKVEAAVRRGDLIAVQPGAVPARPAANVERPKPVPRVEAPKDPRALAVFETARAKEAFAAGQYGRAAERLADAITANPADARPHFLLAQVRVARGEYAEAVEAVREGVKRNPDWPAAAVNLKEFYGAAGPAFGEHLAELRAAAKANPADPTVAFLLGYHLWFLGDRAAAVRLFRDAAKRVKDAAVIERFLREADERSPTR